MLFTKLGFSFAAKIANIEKKNKTKKQDQCRLVLGDEPTILGMFEEQDQASFCPGSLFQVFMSVVTGIGVSPSDLIWLLKTGWFGIKHVYHCVSICHHLCML
jgi:hypothetical protein